MEAGLSPTSAAAAAERCALAASQMLTGLLRAACRTPLCNQHDQPSALLLPWPHTPWPPLPPPP